ncbi:HU family DNA-binding protein [Burkholderia stagnalis]|uniref:HU family DNA-binding protein n=1 Tax=Burkholderia stagnalis TaxID=1503054 RepID=UPI000F57A259|nr:HU family DNA-binding protein [Burkholderia stagnalis]RQR11338.1 HU family DNA-binding protein [Burkholderia stagnalis]RQR20367.1 HU family DNA-binding protein [Burkholderia stagnalis]
MSKTILTSLIADQHGLTRAEADEILKTVFDGIQSALSSQGSITFVNFGRFSVHERAPRVGRNPGTGEAVPIPARRVVKFSASDALTSAVNPKKKK